MIEKDLRAAALSCLSRHVVARLDDSTIGETPIASFRVGRTEDTFQSTLSRVTPF
jgi:hypothetical protein